MTPYRKPAESETDPQAPLTSQLMKACAKNADAISEGASGAPRVQSRALAPFVASTTGVHTDLGDIATIMLNTGIFVSDNDDNSSSGVVRYRRSSDNGTTWGAYENALLVGTSGDSANPETVPGSASVLIDMGPTFNAIDVEFHGTNATVTGTVTLIGIVGVVD